ncbi:unnamed protein product [Trypanosoma congolense IL3000]|uniref:WGS project CAEQ00000000 data, annotated contig 1946 n=1 Tax=Trypanosoma congolense (strain IL3000) TaxID=1068625 RepID=F9WA79_TRYCI|nr:unnamed protein product [Trypanosoma congolense IL3000]
MNSSRRPAEWTAKAAALDASLSNCSTSFLVLSISFRTCRNRRSLILHAFEPLPLDLDCTHFFCHSSKFISMCVTSSAPSSTCCVVQGVMFFKVLLKVHMVAQALVWMAWGPVPKMSSASRSNMEEVRSRHHLERNSITLGVNRYSILLVTLRSFLKIKKGV